MTTFYALIYAMIMQGSAHEQINQVICPRLCILLHAIKLQRKFYDFKRKLMRDSSRSKKLGVIGIKLDVDVEDKSFQGNRLLRLEPETALSKLFSPFLSQFGLNSKYFYITAVLIAKLLP